MHEKNKEEKSAETMKSVQCEKGNKFNEKRKSTKHMSWLHYFSSPFPLVVISKYLHWLEMIPLTRYEDVLWWIYVPNKMEINYHIKSTQNPLNLLFLYFPEIKLLLCIPDIDIINSFLSARAIFKRRMVEKYCCTHHYFLMFSGMQFANVFRSQYLSSGHHLSFRINVHLSHPRWLISKRCDRNDGFTVVGDCPLSIITSDHKTIDRLYTWNVVHYNLVKLFSFLSFINTEILPDFQPICQKCVQNAYIIHFFSQKLL